jgi:hypothetical protein
MANQGNNSKKYMALDHFNRVILSKGSTAVSKGPVADAVDAATKRKKTNQVSLMKASRKSTPNDTNQQVIGEIAGEIAEPNFTADILIDNSSNTRRNVLLIKEVYSTSLRNEMRFTMSSLEAEGRAFGISPNKTQQMLETGFASKMRCINDHPWNALESELISSSGTEFTDSNSSSRGSIATEARQQLQQHTNKLAAFLKDLKLAGESEFLARNQPAANQANMSKASSSPSSSSSFHPRDLARMFLEFESSKQASRGRTAAGSDSDGSTVHAILDDESIAR